MMEDQQPEAISCRRGRTVTHLRAARLPMEIGGGARLRVSQTPGGGLFLRGCIARPTVDRICFSVRQNGFFDPGPEPGDPTPKQIAEAAAKLREKRQKAAKFYQTDEEADEAFAGNGNPHHEIRPEPYQVPVFLYSANRLLNGDTDD